MALGVAAFVPTAPRGETEADDGSDWPGNLIGRHKQVVDAYTVNDGFPLCFVLNFLSPNKSATRMIILPSRSRSTTQCGRNTRSASSKRSATPNPSCSGKDPYFAPKP
jgi:hypothetical protein